MALRCRCLRLLSSVVPDDFVLCREVEAHCHSLTSSVDEYTSHVTRCAYNLLQNPRLGLHVVYSSDRASARDTIVGRMEDENETKVTDFQKMLQQKYDELDDQKFEAIVRCRRCGSEDVSWEEKQTRSADEGGSVFCVCTKCKTRWVMR